MVYNSMRIGKKPGDPTVTDIKAIQYLPTGEIMYKLSFDVDFVNLLQRKNWRFQTADLVSKTTQQ